MPSSFGLGPDYREKVLLEEIFYLTRYLKNVSWTEAWDMPVVYRKWLLEREKRQRQSDEEEEAKRRARRKRG